MQKTSNHIKLGALVTTGTVLLILSLYLIGSKQNLFNKTITIHAVFKNVNGLISGNNVRFAGINIGTIKKVNIVDDSTVVVTMIIEEESNKFIRKNSLADIGSDGLMGNKLVNISSTSQPAAIISPGDTLQSMIAVATDDMMRTLSSTNDNVFLISGDLKNITKRINENKVIWKLLGDSTIAINFKNSLHNFEQTSINANQLSNNLEEMLKEIHEGKGTLGKLVEDKATADNLSGSIQNLKDASDTAKLALHHMHEFMRDLNITPGSLGVLARDTAMANDMKSTMYNLNQSSYNLNENMKALRTNFFFKKYFKKQDKLKKEAESKK